MSDNVSFNDENTRLKSVSNNQSRLPGLLVTYGIAKTNRQAEFLILGFVVLLIVVSIIFFTKGTSSTGLSNPSDDLINAPQPIGPLN